MEDKHKIGRDGIPEDGVSHYPADGHDLESFEDARRALEGLSTPILYRGENPHERLFFAAFDGTGNDADNDPAHKTNVGAIRDQILAVNKAGNPAIRVAYVEGIGTQSNPIARALDGAIGYSYDERLERMYLKFVNQAKEWLHEDPNAQIRVADIGFSRGAEQAASFARMVHERGIVDPDSKVVRVDEHGHRTVEYTRHLVPPGQIAQAVGLFDPVGTGAPRDYDRRLPPSVISGFQITAEDERRGLFKSTSIIDPGMTADGRFLNVMVGGAHSDNGGSYHLNGLSIRSGNLMIDYLNSLSDEPFLTKTAVPGDPAMNVVHRSEEGMFIYRLSGKVDRRTDEGVVEVLAPAHICRAVEDCHNAEPMDAELAARFERRNVPIDPVSGELPGVDHQVRAHGAEKASMEDPFERLAAAAMNQDYEEARAVGRAFLSSAEGQAWRLQAQEHLAQQPQQNQERHEQQQSVEAPVMAAPVLRH